MFTRVPFLTYGPDLRPWNGFVDKLAMVYPFLVNYQNGILVQYTNYSHNTERNKKGERQWINKSHTHQSSYTQIRIEATGNGVPNLIHHEIQHGITINDGECEKEDYCATATTPV